MLSFVVKKRAAEKPADRKRVVKKRATEKPARYRGGE
jgi:hypothetical protein